MNLQTSPHSLLSFAWTLTSPTNQLEKNNVFSYSKIIFFVCFFFFFFFFFEFYFILCFFFIIIFFFFIKIIFIFSCSGMFRHVPFSEFYRRPNEIAFRLFKLQYGLVGRHFSSVSGEYSKKIPEKSFDIFGKKNNWFERTHTLSWSIQTRSVF